jgi:hypothetical protein
MFNSVCGSTKGAVAAALAALAALAAMTAVLTLAAPAAAQNETALKAYFEGKRVTLRIDMPGTSGGVDVEADASRAVDYERYGDDLKRYGTAIRAGDSVSVTLVKVKKDLIEFQLAGGGFGTFGDDTSTSVSMPLVGKSEREKSLEKRVRDEGDDRDRRRDLEREIDDLRDRRERENRRITVERERAEDRKRERIAEQRSRGGSRFNLRYADRVPVGVRPEDLVAALAEYVDFRAADARGDGTKALTGPSGDISLLRKGMLRSDAERAFGTAVDSSERHEGNLAIRTLVFIVGEQRIAADFVEDVLIRYTMASQ